MFKSFKTLKIIIAENSELVSFVFMQNGNYRLQIWFKGRVQGVGFRYKTLQLSKAYEVVGFVRNLDDGRVHLCALGEKSECRDFVEDVKNTMSPFIKDFFEQEDFFNDSYKNFTIISD